MRIETDLKVIAQNAKEREDENFEFRSYLKMQSESKIDLIVHELNNEISSLIDCTKCANCCEKLKSKVLNNEIVTLSKLENLSANEYKSLYIEEDMGSFYINSLPCKYLQDKKCTIYENRPHDCKSYPNTHKKEFLSRLFSIINNYEICPIVYNVYENLKFKTNFKTRNKKRRFHH